MITVEVAQVDAFPWIVWDGKTWNVWWNSQNEFKKFHAQNWVVGFEAALKFHALVNGKSSTPPAWMRNVRWEEKTGTLTTAIRHESGIKRTIGYGLTPQGIMTALKKSVKSFGVIPGQKKMNGFEFHEESSLFCYWNPDSQSFCATRWRIGGNRKTDFVRKTFSVTNFGDIKSAEKAAKEWQREKGWFIPAPRR